MPIRDAERLLRVIRALHAEIRTAVVDATERQSVDARSAADESQPGDTIFAVDRVSEERLVAHVAGRAG